MKLRRDSLVGLLGALTALGCGDADSDPAAARRGLVHVEGAELKDASGSALALEGVGVGEIEDDSAYAEIAKLGANEVRLYFSLAQLVDAQAAAGSYRAEGLAWLDDHIALARANGLYAVLALNASDLDCSHNAFWDSADAQQQMLDLWRMLAERYAADTTIAGYSLLDPVYPKASVDQWQKLAERATQAIREVDRGHVVFVGRAQSVGCEFSLPPAETLVTVADDNAVYELDRTQPWSYVAQLTNPPFDSNDAPLPYFSAYPNETLIIVDSDAAWLYSSEDSRPSATSLKLKPDETEWIQKVFYYTVTDPQFEIALPVLQADFVAGKAYYDDVLVEEVTHAGASVIERLPLDVLDESWYFWQGNSDGKELKDAPGNETAEVDAHEGEGSFAISGTTTYGNLTSSSTAFKVSLGSTYRVTSWVKGEGITSGAAFARVRLDFRRNPKPAHGFNRQTLEELFVDFTAWGRARGVPMMVSSFATGRPTFENGLGGELWVSDMIDIMREQQLGFSYWGYRDHDFGLLSVSPADPDHETINQPLVDVLTEKLSGRPR